MSRSLSMIVLAADNAALPAARVLANRMRSKTDAPILLTADYQDAIEHSFQNLSILQKGIKPSKNRIYAPNRSYNVTLDTLKENFMSLAPFLEHLRGSLKNQEIYPHCHTMDPVFGFASSISKSRCLGIILSGPKGIKNKGEYIVPDGYKGAEAVLNRNGKVAALYVDSNYKKIAHLREADTKYAINQGLALEVSGLQGVVHTCSLPEIAKYAANVLR